MTYAIYLINSDPSIRIFISYGKGGHLTIFDSQFEYNIHTLNNLISHTCHPLVLYYGKIINLYKYKIIHINN